MDQDKPSSRPPSAPTYLTHKARITSIVSSLFSLVTSRLSWHQQIVDAGDTHRCNNAPHPSSEPIYDAKRRGVCKRHRAWWDARRALSSLAIPFWGSRSTKEGELDQDGWVTSSLARSWNSTSP